jgi:hypothetical protein
LFHSSDFFFAPWYGQSGLLLRLANNDNNNISNNGPQAVAFLRNVVKDPTLGRILVRVLNKGMMMMIVIIITKVKCKVLVVLVVKCICSVVKVPGSNFGRDTRYSDGVLSV